MILEEILQALKECDSNIPVKASDGKYIKKDFFSDRGDYSKLCLDFTYASNDSAIRTVGEMIDFLEEVKAIGTMEGYKGGDFEINSWTPVSIGMYGYSGYDISHTVVKDGIFYIVIGEYKFIEIWNN